MRSLVAVLFMVLVPLTSNAWTAGTYNCGYIYKLSSMSIGSRSVPYLEVNYGPNKTVSGFPTLTVEGKKESLMLWLGAGHFYINFENGQPEKSCVKID